MADKILFFDAGPIISLVMSRVAWILPELKKKFGGKFYITPAVQKELVERPLSVKRYEFEALQVMKFIREGVLEVYTNVPQKKVQELQLLANTSFSIAGKSMDIIQSGEMESVASALQLKAAVVMDERTLRLFIENSLELQGILEYRFSSKIQADKIKIKQFSASLQGIPIIRSTELVGIAYKLGLLDGFIPPGKGGKDTLLDAVLWATKYNGCAITEQEIEEIKNYLLK
ncbi:MAG: hypothetical protein Q7K45_02305 [Nanoarchaeota archaeon]|nr:hypothetical protein [Nanoarchaeota archaeon]